MAAEDILVGPGWIWYAPVGEANPDESTIGFGEAWGGNWIDLGELQEEGPVNVNMPEEIFKVYGQHTASPYNASRTRRELTIAATLLEHTVTNMALVLQGTVTTVAAAGGGQKGYSDIDFGASAHVQIFKWGIEFLRKDANDVEQPARWFLPRGYIRLAGATAYDKRASTGIPIEIVVLADPDLGNTVNLGKLQIVTAAATAT